MAKSGTVETEERSLVKCDTKECIKDSRDTTMKKLPEEYDKEEEELERYTRALLASLSITGESEHEDELISTADESTDSNHYSENYSIQHDRLFRGGDKITTANSLIVESLLQDLCQVYISDVEKSRQYYHMICQILFQMKVIDESYRMNEFEGMRNQYQRVFHHLLNTPVASSIPAWPSIDVTNEWSHYHREFDEIKYIAGGGFGRVFLVRHKLDGTDYAVKKIFIRSKGIKSVMKYLSEVKTFAALNHANIVQYKAAWLELGVYANKNDSSDNSESDNDDSGGSNSSNVKTNSLPVVAKQIDNNTNYIYPDIISVETSLNQQETVNDTNFEVKYKQSSADSSYMKRYSASTTTSLKRNVVGNIRDMKQINLKGKQRRRPKGNGTVIGQKWATLYIQMTFYPSTLQQWLQERNLMEKLAENATALVPLDGRNARYETIIEILRQLLKGLKYIHSKKIVHHDIKPSNIFIQEDNGCILVQLGDFGLACPLQSARHSIAGGTKLYAAPEQIEGTCVSKSDIYSLGIVLLELAASFRTDMERVRRITELRKTNGQSAAEFLVNSSAITNGNVIYQSKMATVISQVMVSRYDDRPDAESLLKNLTRMATESDCSNINTEATCRDKLSCADMNIVIEELRMQLAQKDAEITRLLELLKQADIPGKHTAIMK